VKRGLLAALVVVGASWSCSDASGPGSGSATAHVTDPTGDTYGTGVVGWDLTDMTITRDTGGITLLLDFASNVISPASGDTTAMIGYVDFDIDQDSTTGSLGSVVDGFRPNTGSTGMGVEYELIMVGYGADSSVIVIDSVGTTGRVKPVFNGKRVTVRIPKALLGNDDGYLSAAAIVGDINSPSDIIPENGHLSLSGPGSMTAYMPTVSANRSGVSGATRSWKALAARRLSAGL
jgi:hypothetical protein